MLMLYNVFVILFCLFVQSTKFLFLYTLFIVVLAVFSLFLHDAQLTLLETR